MNVANFAVNVQVIMSYIFSSFLDLYICLNIVYLTFCWIHLNLTADAQNNLKLVSFICQIERTTFYVKWHELRKHAHSRLLKHYKSNLEITVPSKTFGMFLISEWISILPFHFLIFKHGKGLFANDNIYLSILHWFYRPTLTSMVNQTLTTEK